jgi:hypothetical protein
MDPGQPNRAGYNREPHRRAAQDEASAPQLAGNVFTRDDPLWKIVGMIDETGEAWVSGDKRRALGDAYASHP